MKRSEIDSETLIKAIREKAGLYFRTKAPRLLRPDVLLAVFMTFILAMLVAPSLLFMESDHRAGMIAKEDIKADRDFLVEEKLSTEMKRAAILRMTPAVFDYDSTLPDKYQAKITELFKIIADAMKQPPAKTPRYPDDQEDRRVFYANIFRDYAAKHLGTVLNDKEFAVFYRHNFSEVTARALCKVIDKIYTGNYVTENQMNKTDRERGIRLYDVARGTESIIRDFDGFITLETAKTRIAGHAGNALTGYDQDFHWAAVSFLQKIIRPNLTLNESATERAKEDALKTIKPSYFQVLKNEMIVREGEKISQTIQDKLDAYYAIKGGKNRFSDISAFLGILLIIFLTGGVLYYPVRNWNPKSHELNATLLFLALVTLLQFVLIRFGLIISDSIALAFPAIAAEDCFFAIPFAMGAMLVSVIVNDRIAMLFGLFTALLAGFVFDGNIMFSVYTLAGSFFAVYQLSRATHRAAFFVTGLLLGVFNGVAIIAFSLFNKAPFDLILLVNLAMGFIGGIISGIIVSGILPLFEGLFKFTTDIRLLELGNLNQPFFQRMIIETPGTYHHSIIVASLVESAAEAIGANAMLAKVSAYYHDIGKLTKPQYFIENQPTGENKHEKLSPKMSSLIIISHVKDGCDIAQKLKLGNPITNIIRQHHGTSLVTFFYDKARKDPDANRNTLSDSDFRYPGPKPQTKEAGLVMLGDVIEASSRTLDDPTPSRISNLVHERIEKIFLDGQLDECDLTLRDLNKIADSFIRILNGIFHHRISYPDDNTLREGLAGK